MSFSPRSSRSLRVGALAFAAVVLVGLTTASGAAAEDPVPSAVPAAACGPGSAPETGLQGQVPLADRQSGRSQRAYSCNLELLGRYQGQGQATVGASYGHCQYLGTIISGTPRAKSPGVNVVDLSDPKNPRLAGSLRSPAMLGGTWETLKVNTKRGLLAAVSVGPGSGGVFFSVYDVKTDCAKPRLLNSVAGTDLTLPLPIPGHEGGWSPDGKTYWATGAAAGTIAAIDVANPKLPKVVYLGSTGLANHGFGVSQDGNRIYVANIAPAGFTTFDATDIQRRKLFPRLRRISDISWSDGLISQHAIPFTDGGRPYLLAVDEFGSGGARVIDISDERDPRVVRKLKLEINRPEHADRRAEDTSQNGVFGYEAHYCSLDRLTDPTALACGWTQSGIRVFDMRDPLDPREIAYFTPPGQVGKNSELVNSAHATIPVGATASDFINGNIGDPPLNLGPTDLTADWCMSPPLFRGGQLWVACDDNGAMALRFTNGAYPLPGS
ncbi:MAG: LVIVD repeat-containing protein [Thermocrispum sp.]